MGLILQETYKGALDIIKFYFFELLFLQLLFFLVWAIRSSTKIAFKDKSVRLGWLNSKWLKKDSLDLLSQRELESRILLKFNRHSYKKLSEGRYKSTYITLFLATLTLVILNHAIVSSYVKCMSLYYVITFWFAAFVHDCHSAVGYHYWTWFYILFPAPFYFFSFCVYRSGIFQSDLFEHVENCIIFYDACLLTWRGLRFRYFYYNNIIGIKATCIANMGTFIQWLYNPMKDKFSFMILFTSVAFSFKEFIDQKEFSNFMLYGFNLLFGESQLLTKLSKSEMRRLFVTQGAVQDANQYLLLLRNLANLKDLVYSLKKWFLGHVLRDETDQEYYLTTLFPEFRVFLKLHEIFEVVTEDQLAGDKRLQELFVKYIARKRKLDKVLLSTGIDREYRTILRELKGSADRKVSILKNYRDSSNGFRQEPISIVIEGPSGIGKSTYLAPALHSLIFHGHEEYEFCKDNGNFRYNNDFLALKSSDKSFTADDLWRLQYNVNSSVAATPFAEFLEIHNKSHYLMNKPKLEDKDSKLMAKIHTYLFNDIPIPPHVHGAKIAIMNRMHTLRVYLHPKILKPKEGKEEEYQTRLANFKETVTELTWFHNNCLTPRGAWNGDEVALESMPEEIRDEAMRKYYSHLTNYLFFIGHEHSAWKNPIGEEKPIIVPKTRPDADSKLFNFNRRECIRIELDVLLGHLRGRFKENFDDCVRANQGIKERSFYGLFPTDLNTLIAQVNELEKEEKDNPQIQTNDVMKMAQKWIPSLIKIEEEEVGKIIESQSFNEIAGPSFTDFSDVSDMEDDETHPKKKICKHLHDTIIIHAIYYNDVITRKELEEDFFENIGCTQIGIILNADEYGHYGVKREFAFLLRDQTILKNDKDFRDYFLSEVKYYENMGYASKIDHILREIREFDHEDFIKKKIESRTWMQCAKDLAKEVENLRIDDKWKLFFPVFIISVVVIVILFLIYMSNKEEKSFNSKVCDKEEVINLLCHKEQICSETLYISQGVNSTKQDFDRSMLNKTLPNGDQSTAEVLSRVAENNLLICEFRAKDGSFKFMGNALALRGRTIMICSHYIIYKKDFYISQCGKDRIKIDLEKCKTLKKELIYSDDIIILELPDTFPFSFKNISSFLAEEVSVEPLPSVTMLSLWGNREKHLIVLNNINNTEVSCNELRYYHDEDNKENSFRIKKVIKYSVRSTRGMCGSLIFGTNSKNYNKIIGMHVAGVNGSMGAAAVIEQRDIISFQSQGAVEESKFIISEGPKIPLVYKSPIVKSIFYNTIKKHRENHPYKWKEKVVKDGELIEEDRSLDIYPTKFPAPVRPKMIDGKNVHPLDVRFGKFRVNKEYDFDEVAIQCVRNDMLFHKKCGIYDVSYQKGFFGDGRVMKPLDRQTSTGFFGLLQQEEKKRKRQYWLPYMDDQGDIHYSPGTKELIVKLDDMYHHLTENEMEIVFVVHPKADECLPEQKIIDNNARGIYAGPLDVLVLCRALFYDLQAWVINNKIENDYAIGLNPYGRDWSNLVQKLKTIPKSAQGLVYMDIDVKTQEIVMYQKRFKEEMFSIVMSFYSKCDPKDNTVRLNMLKSIFNNNKLLYDGLYYGGMDLNPSGHPLTALINSLATIWWHRYIYYSIQHRHKGNSFTYWTSRFNDYVNLVAMGDDMICGVDKSIIGHYRPSSIKKEFIKYGIEITPAEKDSDLLYKNKLEDCTFLKRYFAVCSMDKKPVGLLIRESIFNSLFWCKSREHLISSSGQNVSGLLFEASLYGREFHKYIYDIVEVRESGVYNSNNKLDLDQYKLSYGECIGYRQYHMSGEKAHRHVINPDKYTYF